MRKRAKSRPNLDLMKTLDSRTGHNHNQLLGSRRDDIHDT
jgi:hypothetical protein